MSISHSSIFFIRRLAYLPDGMTRLKALGDFNISSSITK